MLDIEFRIFNLKLVFRISKEPSELLYLSNAVCNPLIIQGQYFMNACHMCSVLKGKNLNIFL